MPLNAGWWRVSARDDTLTFVEDHGAAADDDASLSAYGDAVDVVARVPTLTGAVVAAIAVGLVWTWQWALRRRRNA